MSERIDPAGVIWMTPEAERAGRPLLVLLHGRGSNEHDLIGLSDAFPAEFAVASVRATIPEGSGFSWFVMTSPGNPPPDAVNGAADALLSWIDGLPEAPTGVGLLGFSQGGVIALQALRRAPQRIAFALNLSGFVAAGAERGDEAIGGHPVFWGRGEDDVVIVPPAIQRTEEWLPAHVALESRVYPGLAHSVSREELDDIGAFLRARR